MYDRYKNSKSYDAVQHTSAGGGAGESTDSTTLVMPSRAPSLLGLLAPVDRAELSVSYEGQLRSQPLHESGSSTRECGPQQL